MTSRFKAISLLGLSLTLAACGQGTPAADPGTFSLSTLQPGQKQDIDAAVKVNVVLVGYHPTAPGQVAGPRDVNVSDFTSILPGTGRNIARIPSAYGALESTGNTYTYQYNYVYASQSFEDNFFSYLTSKGTEKPLTVYQKAYNCQSTDDLSCATPATNITGWVLVVSASASLGPSWMSWATFSPNASEASLRVSSTAG